MTSFFDLFARHSADPTLRDDPTWADRQFRELVASSPFQLWRPGEPIIFKDNVRLLIGVATWSGYDMRLLDVIAEALRRDLVDPPTLDVFNTIDCPNADDFARYLPDLCEVSETPVVGVFRQEGPFSSSFQGHAAREAVSKLFGSSSTEIVCFVQDWIEGRALAH